MPLSARLRAWTLATFAAFALGSGGDAVADQPANQLTASEQRSGWKLIFDGPRRLLFNLRTDIGERNDVIGAHSDIARRLRPLLAAWQADVDVEARRATPR